VLFFLALVHFFDTKYISPLTGFRSAGLVDTSFEPTDDVYGFVEFTPRDSLLKKNIDHCRRLSVSMVEANHLDQSQHLLSLLGRRHLPRI
jgi:hypothetical protein